MAKVVGQFSTRLKFANGGCLWYYAVTFEYAEEKDYLLEVIIYYTDFQCMLSTILYCSSAVLPWLLKHALPLFNSFIKLIIHTFGLSFRKLQSLIS